jgi:hypothetical protein
LRAARWVDQLVVLKVDMSVCASVVQRAALTVLQRVDWRGCDLVDSMAAM